MGTITDKLNYLTATKTAIKTAIIGKGVSVPADTTFRQYAALISQIQGGAEPELQAGSVIPTGSYFVKHPDEGYDGFSQVAVVGDVNLKPENIAEGITIYGVQGEMRLAPTTSMPAEYQIYLDYAETLYGGSYDNFMILENNNYLNVCFLMSDFLITDYNSATSDFCASGWFICGYCKPDGTWTTSDWRLEASAGGNLISHIRYASCYIMYGATALYPFNSYANVVGDGSVAVAFLHLTCPHLLYISLTCGENTRSFQFTPQATQCTLALPTTGTWAGTLTNPDNDVSRNVSFDIAPYVYDENAFLPDVRTLENDSWAEIAAIANAGNGPMYYVIGDEKNVTLTSGKVLTFQIIGFNHDTLSNGTGFAGITFCAKNCMETTKLMNATDTNVGGWSASAMRAALQPGGSIYELLPSDLKAVIQPVRKVTSLGNKSSALETTDDHLFLLSEVEVFGTITDSKSGEGTRYGYYANYANTNARRIKRSSNGAGSAAYWWERSPYGSSTSGFCAVSSDGTANYYYASYAYGVSPGFCI